MRPASIAVIIGGMLAHFPVIFALAACLASTGMIVAKGRGSHPNPGYAEINTGKGPGICAYKSCKKPVAGTHELLVTRQRSTYKGGGLTVIHGQTGEEQRLGLCAEHAVFAREGRWPDQAFFLTIAVVFFASLFGGYMIGFIIQDYLYYKLPGLRPAD